jgi:hypothetical protein
VRGASSLGGPPTLGRARGFLSQGFAARLQLESRGARRYAGGPSVDNVASREPAYLLWRITWFCEPAHLPAMTRCALSSLQFPSHVCSGIRTVKSSGCNHMTCSKCKASWCWLCAKVCIAVSVVRSLDFLAFYCIVVRDRPCGCATRAVSRHSRWRRVREPDQALLVAPAAARRSPFTSSRVTCIKFRPSARPCCRSVACRRSTAPWRPRTTRGGT